MEHIGQRFVQRIETTFNGEEWKGTLKITQYKTEDGEHWEDRSVAAEAIDSTENKVIAHLFATTAIYLEKLGGDLFTELPEETTGELSN